MPPGEIGAHWTKVAEEGFCARLPGASDSGAGTRNGGITWEWVRNSLSPPESNHQFWAWGPQPAV